MQTLPASAAKHQRPGSSSGTDGDTLDATCGTHFELVKAADECTPSALSSWVVRNSVEGLAYLEAVGALHPPFRVNRAGTVAEVSGAQPTVGGSGKPIRTLVVVDAKGCHANLRQLGSGAEDKDVHPGCKLVVYFLSGRKALKEGEVDLMDMAGNLKLNNGIAFEIFSNIFLK